MSMSIEFPSGDVMTVKVSGQLTSAQWWAAQNAAAAQAAQATGKLAVLVIVEDFDGWAPGGWDDASSLPAFDRQVGRFAIVGDTRWKDEVLMFVGQGVRRFPIEYFPPSGLAEARRWLELNDGTNGAPGGTT